MKSRPDKLLDEIRICLQLMEFAEEKLRAEMAFDIHRKCLKSYATIFLSSGGSVFFASEIKRWVEQYPIAYKLGASLALSFLLFVIAVNIKELSPPPFSRKLMMTRHVLRDQEETTRLHDLQQKLNIVSLGRFFSIKDNLKEEEAKRVRKYVFLSGGQNPVNRGSPLFEFFSTGENAAIDIVKTNIFPRLR